MISSQKIVNNWVSDNKTEIAYVDAKGKSTIASVKKWIKENKPNEFYCRFDTKIDDDSVQIYYR